MSRSALLGMIAVLMPLLAGPSLADGFDTNNLVRFGETNGVALEPWVSTDPISTATVKKIEGGRVTYVTITRTSTGVYSSDGIRSRNVSYPGVIEPRGQVPEFHFSSWNDGKWTSFRTYQGNSYVSVVSHKTPRGVTRTTACISSASFLYC
jgi:hypothetical protein